MRPFTIPFLLLGLTPVLLLNCSDSVEQIEPTSIPFKIRVDSVRVPGAICYGESLSVQFWARIGPNNCYRFARFEIQQGDSGTAVTLWGEQLLSSDCTGDTVRLQARELKILPASPGIAHIRVSQPDSTALGAIVDVKTALSPLGSEPVVIAILIVDYQTHVFEGGSIGLYPACRNCNCISLPFQVRFQPPGDFGWIGFSYIPNQQEFFHATIVWHGQGSIQQPSHFAPADSFATTADSIPQPPFVGRYSWTGASSSDNIAETDRVWASICRLDLLRQFEPSSFRVGFYFYPPGVQSGNPRYFKWIVFACGRMPASSWRRLPSGSRQKVKHGGSSTT